MQDPERLWTRQSPGLGHSRYLGARHRPAAAVAAESVGCGRSEAMIVESGLNATKNTFPARLGHRLDNDRLLDPHTRSELPRRRAQGAGPSLTVNQSASRSGSCPILVTGLVALAGICGRTARKGGRYCDRFERCPLRVHVRWAPLRQ